MTQAVTKFIAIVGVHFPMPNFKDEETEKTWLKSMVRVLGSYDADVLAEAAHRIVTTTRTDKYRGPRFPLPADCVAVCEDIVRVKAAGTRPLIAGPSVDPWTKDRFALANDLMRTEMGRTAAREGWVLALWHFAWANARLPAGGELTAIKAAAAGLHEAVSICEAGQGGACSKALANLGRQIMAKGDRLKAKVLGEASP